MKKVHEHYYSGYNEGFKTAMKLTEAQMISEEQESTSLFDCVSKQFMRASVKRVLERYLRDYHNLLLGKK